MLARLCVVVQIVLSVPVLLVRLAHLEFDGLT